MLVFACKGLHTAFSFAPASVASFLLGVTLPEASSTEVRHCCRCRMVLQRLLSSVSSFNVKMVCHVRLSSRADTSFLFLFAVSEIHTPTERGESYNQHCLAASTQYSFITGIAMFDSVQCHQSLSSAVQRSSGTYSQYRKSC